MSMRRLSSSWGIAQRVGRRFFADACSGRAAGLAFSSLFALVPLSAFVVAVLSAFGAFDPLIDEAQQALLQQLVPAVHEEVFASIRQFASNTRALGFLGFFIFLGTAVLLLRNINISMNAIWGFRTRRGVWAKVASYTTIIVIGTTLISASFAVGPIVQSVILAAWPETAQATWFRSYVLPPLFLFVTLFSLNILVPAGKVRSGSAALGAGVSVVIWELAKRLFVFWTTSVMRLNLIYGSLAVLPIFLIWLYLTWFFVLIGVEVAYVFQHRSESASEETADTARGPISDVLDGCVQIALEVGRHYRVGLPPVTREDLDYRLGAVTADRVRVSLAESGLFLDTDHGLLPARDIASITIGDVVDTVIAGAGGGAAGDEHSSLPTGSTSTVGRLLGLWREDPGISLVDERLMHRSAADGPAVPD